MKLLTFIILMLLSLPILMPEPLSTLEVGKGTGEEIKSPVELPMKPQSIPYDQTWDEEDCLSHTIYWESKGEAEGKLGMVLVGLVVVHRAKSSKSYFPNSICSVVKKPKAFSYFWDGKSDVPKEQARFELAKTVAKEILVGKYNGLLPESVLYYKRCDTFSKFFEELKFYKRHVSHCYYLEG